MTISELSVRRPVFALMLISFLVVLGLFSFRDLGVDLFPKADPATVNITVSLPGATPEEMATQVVLPIEEAVNTISGLDELSSQTSEGSARVTCTFVLERDIEGAAQDVREKVAGALRSLPPNILPPVIQKSDPDADPVLTIAVASDKNIRETTEISDKQIKRVLETVDGVGAVAITGGRSRQIRLYADAEKLNAYGITINQFERAIQSENVEIPGGRIVRGGSEVGVRTLGRVDAVSQFADIIVANVNGSPVRVRDVGRVEDTFAEPTTWNMVDGKESVKLDVRRQSGTNTVQIVHLVRDKLAQIQKTLPVGVDIKVIADKSIFIDASVAALKEHLLYGSLLASLVVLLFIRSLRSVVIASLAIPTSIIATFTLLKVMNFTLNNMEDVSFHYSNLWFAGQKKNWPLAMFYYNETRNHIRWLLQKSPTTKTPEGEVVNLQGIFDGLDTSSLAMLKKSIEDKRIDEFTSAYKLMLDGCYSCHKSAGRPYLRLGVPTVAPQSIVSYNPEAN